MLSERFEQALVFATRLHSRQVRKGNEIPYIAHLLAVASIVLENGGSEDEAIAALLHDAVEDQGGAITLQKIDDQFGHVVSEIVLGCSDTDATPKPPWRARKEVYIQHLPNSSPSIKLVSLADKLHNVRSVLSDYRKLGKDLWPRFKGGRNGTLWYYRSLLDTFQEVFPGPLTDEYGRVVAELEKLVELFELEK